MIKVIMSNCRLDFPENMHVCSSFTQFTHSSPTVSSCGWTVGTNWVCPHGAHSSFTPWSPICFLWARAQFALSGHRLTCLTDTKKEIRVTLTVIPGTRIKCDTCGHYTLELGWTAHYSMWVYYAMWCISGPCTVEDYLLGSSFLSLLWSWWLYSKCFHNW